MKRISEILHCLGNNWQTLAWNIYHFSILDRANDIISSLIIKYFHLPRGIHNQMWKEEEVKVMYKDGRFEMSSLLFSSIPITSRLWTWECESKSFRVYPHWTPYPHRPVFNDYSSLYCTLTSSKRMPLLSLCPSSLDNFLYFVLNNIMAA